MEILVATVREEVDHVLISAHRAKNFFFFECAGVVLVDHLERLAREAQKLGGELFVGRGARALAALALLLERARLVDVDHLEHLSSGAQKFDGEVLVLGPGRLLAALALVRQLVEALGEAAVDRLLPCAQINQ